MPSSTASGLPNTPVASDIWPSAGLRTVVSPETVRQYASSVQGSARILPWPRNGQGHVGPRKQCIKISDISDGTGSEQRDDRTQVRRQRDDAGERKNRHTFLSL